MTPAQILFDKIATVENYPMRGRDHSVTYFYKGRKITKFADGTFTCWDITHREGIYKVQSEQKICEFLNTHFPS